MTAARSDEPANDLTSGLNALANADWPTAVRLLTAAVRRESGRLAVARALTTAHLHAGDTASARRVMAQFLLDHPTLPEGWRLAAQLEWKLGQRDEAIRLLTRGIDHLPQSPLLHRQLDLYLGANGDPTAADRRREWARPMSIRGYTEPDWLDRLAREPGLVDGLLQLAASAADAPILRELVARITRLLATQPRHADRQLALARLQQRVNDLPSAARSVQRALAENPRYADALRLRAEVSSDTRQRRAA